KFQSSAGNGKVKGTTPNPCPLRRSGRYATHNPVNIRTKYDTIGCCCILPFRLLVGAFAGSVSMIFAVISLLLLLYVGLLSAVGALSSCACTAMSIAIPISRRDGA